MEKILIRLVVPAVNRTFDIFVPIDYEIGGLTKLLVTGVDDLCAGGYIPSGEELLNLKNPKILLDPNLTLGAYGVKDGTEIYLI